MQTELTWPFSFQTQIQFTFDLCFKARSCVQDSNLEPQPQARTQAFSKDLMFNMHSLYPKYRFDLHSCLVQVQIIVLGSTTNRLNYSFWRSMLNIHISEPCIEKFNHWGPLQCQCLLTTSCRKQNLWNMTFIQEWSLALLWHASLCQLNFKLIWQGGKQVWSARKTTLRT